MEEFKRLLKIQDKCVNRMFRCIDNNNIEGFAWYFELWHDVTSEIYHNPLNECGHKLIDEILDYARKNCFENYDRYYK